MTIDTIGFTKKTAERFFGLLRGSGAVHANRFLELMRHRGVEDVVARDSIDNAVLLCSEDKPHRCHRRLVAEYLAEHWGGVTVEHLV